MNIPSAAVTGVERSPPPPFDVLTWGEPMALFSASSQGPLCDVTAFEKSAAGAELNVAVGLARLGFKVRYLSSLGEDSFGTFLRRFMVAENIDTSWVASDPQRPTGFMMKTLAGEGEDPSTEYFRKGSAAAALGLRDIDALPLASHRALHLTGISPALSASARELSFSLAAGMRKLGRLVCLDPNLRPALWPSADEMVRCLNRLACHADVFLPGFREGVVLTGRRHESEIADFYLAMGVGLVVIKNGEAGAYYKTAESEGRVPAFAVARVVDTVGAGDGFATGVISGLLEGLPTEEAVRRGCAIGARVIGRRGDCEGLPTQAELAACLGASV